jgi:probable phosphoglycerate mutase
VYGAGTVDQSGRLLLIARHGQGFANAERVIAARSCRGLTETGRAQARGLARRLARSGGVSAIHFSTTLRARQSAQIIAAALGINPRRQPGLRVPEAGQAEGMGWIQARRTWPADPHVPRRPRAPGCEPWQAYLDRAQQALQQIIATHPGGRVLVVGHSETLAAMIALSRAAHACVPDALGNHGSDRGEGRPPVTPLDFCAVSPWCLPQLLSTRGDLAEGARVVAGSEGPDRRARQAPDLAGDGV